MDETREIIDALRRRFPHIEGPAREDICYATSNRQWAVKELLGEVDLLLVVGSRNSSNSVRLVEVAHAAGVAAYLVDDASEIDERWLDGVEVVGVTSGASAPERLVRGVCDWFRARGVARHPRVPVRLRGRRVPAAGRAAARRALAPADLHDRNRGVAVDPDLDREHLALDPILPAQQRLELGGKRQDDAVGEREALVLAHAVHLTDEVADATLEHELVVERRVERDGDPVGGRDRPALEAERSTITSSG